MSTYFNIVNLNKKEQASLVIVKNDSQAKVTIENGKRRTNARTWMKRGMLGKNILVIK